MKALLLGLLLTAAACVAPQVPEGEQVPRDGFPTRDVFVINSLAESVTLINSDRVASNHQPWSGQNILFTDRVPNRLVFHHNLGLIINSYGNSLTCFDCVSLQVRSTIPLENGANPWDATLVTRSGRAYALVSNFLTDTVSVVRLQDNGSGGEIVRTLVLDPFPGQPEHRPRPEGIAVLGDRVFVACSAWNFARNDYDQGCVAVLDTAAADPAAWSVSGYLALPTNPQAVYVPAGDGRAHIICTGRINSDDGRVAVLTTDGTSVLTNLPVGGSPCSAAMDQARGRVLLASSGMVLSYSSPELQVVHNARSPLYNAAEPDRYFGGICLDPDNDLLYLSDFAADQVLVLRPGDGTLLMSLPVGDGPLDIQWHRTSLP